ncbi:MAG: LTA synthase family protein, partial [Pseudomonadota bacterium]
GTRTVRGIEAILSGFLPTPGESVIKLGLAQQNFFTIAELLRRRNYSTNFLYGGKSTFDNMNACFRGNGFLNIYDQENFDSPVFTGTWGVSDEDLFAKANEIFKSHGEKPFFALVLTTSNHDPYEFPEGRIELYEEPKATRYNAIKYADYAAGRFFDMAKKEAYYKNTIFLIIADHSTRLRGQDLIPVEKFHIPGIIVGPTVQPGRYDKVASQIDMTPTLLDSMGITAGHPLMGRPLLSFPDSIPGRAVMQYGTTHAVMVESEVLIQQPGLKPLQFTYKDKKLCPSPLDPELAQDALAYALLPNYLYSNQLHRLPPE